jgi:hypothetical protein
MHLVGHLAVALLEQRLLTATDQGKLAHGTLFVASLFPDVVDKTIGYGFKLMPNGRHYAHNLFGLLLGSLGIALILGKSAGYGWFLGHLGHLLADIDGDSQPPWLFPIKQYHFPKGHGLTLVPTSLPRELLLLGLVLIFNRLTR